MENGDDTVLRSRCRAKIPPLPDLDSSLDGECVEDHPQSSGDNHISSNGEKSPLPHQHVEERGHWPLSCTLERICNVDSRPTFLFFLMSVNFTRCVSQWSHIMRWCSSWVMWPVIQLVWLIRMENDRVERGLLLTFMLFSPTYGDTDKKRWLVKWSWEQMSVVSIIIIKIHTDTSKRVLED